MVKTPPKGVRAQTAAPVEIADETSEAYDIPTERAKFRARRTTDERVQRLEEKHDSLSGDVTEIRVTVGTVAGQVSTMVELMKQDAALKQAEVSAEVARANAIIAEHDKRNALADKRKADRATFWLTVLKMLLPFVIAALAALGYRAAS